MRIQIAQKRAQPEGANENRSRLVGGLLDGTSSADRLSHMRLPDPYRVRKFSGSDVNPYGMSVAKTCNICNERKPESDYYATREGTIYGPCKECRRDRANERHAVRRAKTSESFQRLAT